MTDVYVTIKYDFYPDNPRDELSQGVSDIEVGVFSTFGAAKDSIERQYALEQEQDGLFGEDQDKIKWSDHEDRSWTNDFGGEVLIRKMTLSN
jgi:hypothetical protein